MDFLFPIIIAAIIVGLVAVVIIAISGLSSSPKEAKKGKKKDRQAIIRDANRKLAQDSHNPQGLKALADLYFEDKIWEKALSLYGVMLDISSAHKEIDVLETGLRHGICAISSKKFGEAFKGLMMAHKIDPNNAEINYYLGLAFYLNNEFDKAVLLLKKTIVVTPENADAHRYLGLSLSKGKKYKESLAYLKHSLEASPEDKEIMFAIAQSLAETNSIEKSIKIFSHLRADPTFGAESSLRCGNMHANNNQIELAIQDYLIGLKHTNAPLEIQTETKYRLGQCYLKLKKIPEALATLKELQAMSPNYKDVSVLIGRYQELNQNKNLQIYLIASNSEFIVLCKQIVTKYFKEARTRIVNIETTSDHTEILAEVETAKWEDLIVFRFYRTVGVTGEFCIRDFHTKIRDSKAGQGICLTAGTYSDEARKFIDGRPIDLISKPELTRLLSSIGNLSTASAAK